MWWSWASLGTSTFSSHRRPSNCFSSKITKSICSSLFKYIRNHLEMLSPYRKPRIGSSQHLDALMNSNARHSDEKGPYWHWRISVGNGLMGMKRSGMSGARRHRPLGTNDGWIKAMRGRTRCDRCRPSLTSIQRLNNRPMSKPSETHRTAHRS